MLSPPEPKRSALQGPRHFFGQWWRSQTAAHQDSFATLGPLVSVMLFLAAIILAFWYLRNEEFAREQDAVRRDTEVAQQHIRLRLIENQEQLARIARELVTRAINADEFLNQAASFSREHREVTELIWLDAQRFPKAIYSAHLFPKERAQDVPASPLPIELSQAAQAAFSSAMAQRQPAYSPHFTNDQGQAVVQVHVPLIERNRFVGVLLAEYSLDHLIRYLVPEEVSKRHAIALLGDGKVVLASTVPVPYGAQLPAASITFKVPLPPIQQGLVLRGHGYRNSIGLVSNTLFWMVVALSVLTVWMLLGTWRHMRRRLQMQSALITETNFRRAMENSMLTGMRAMDMTGRIIYVNPAFCAMTGFSEAQLIGQRPPYPHWPPDSIEENARLLEQELQGRSPATGVEVKVMRKDGGLFDARMYMSPLIDPKKQQTGWMTSMTNITEAKRIRDQLTASHERFTTVLEGLDAAVSVVSVQQGELLFANRFYRLWFGGQPNGHTVLAGGAGQLETRSSSEADDDVDTLGGLPTQDLTAAGSDTREVYVGAIQKWFDVRTRYVDWTDGRLAQMLIATDITARLNAEALAASQAEKAQVSSRLISMGEMASSVAHELNQPLTAIANYCNGIVSRVSADTIGKEDLVAALQKTSRQAERAGQIIHRIRAFVKRSEPQRQAAQAKAIVEDAVDLAEIELRRRQVTIRTYVAQRLPTLMVDPILIEQVLLNLLKNAAEAIDSAQLPAARRNIELRVVPKHKADEGDIVEFTVTDMGPGIPSEVIARLYEAFFSTKPEGLGIGLSLCRSIIESHRGRIKAQNVYNGDEVVGCCFSFSLPVDVDALTPVAPPVLALQPPSNQPTSS